MAEVVGLVASAISIAGLFNACIEVFEVIKAAQSQELDFQKAILKLNIEKCRLYTWGETMGLTMPSGTSRPRPLDTFRSRALIADILQMLLRLFGDTDKLQERYGCKAEEAASSQLVVTTDTTDHVGNLSTCFSNFKLSHGEVDISLKKKLRWLIQDRKKFPLLLADVREFIDGLQDITKSISSIAIQTQSTVSRIQHINHTETLQLVAQVCEADYPAISDAASVKLEVVSMARTQRDEIEQWKDSIGLSDDSFSEIESMTVTELKHRLVGLLALEHKVVPNALPTRSAGDFPTRPSTSPPMIWIPTQFPHADSELPARNYGTCAESFWSHTPVSPEPIHLLTPGSQRSLREWTGWETWDGSDPFSPGPRAIGGEEIYPLVSPQSRAQLETRENSDYTISGHLGKNRDKKFTDERVCCLHRQCQDENGQKIFFSRKADANIHVKAQHEITYIDCPKSKCERKGEDGFTRRDHLREHLRGFHMENLPKRQALIKSKVSTHSRLAEV